MDEILPTRWEFSVSLLFTSPRRALIGAMCINESEGPSKLFNNSVRLGKKLSHGKLGCWLLDRAFAAPVGLAGRTWTGRIRGERRGETRGVGEGGRRAEAYRSENSGARNESSAVENPDRNQSDSICIMEKARDNVCTELSARATFSPVSFSLSLSPSGRWIVSFSPFFFSLPRPVDSLRIGSGFGWNQRAC